jgi:O-acetyl-ADP-ribose deacetylase (regulator of RNase III)
MFDPRCPMLAAATSCCCQNNADDLGDSSTNMRWIRRTLQRVVDDLASLKTTIEHTNSEQRRKNDSNNEVLINQMETEYENFLLAEQRQNEKFPPQLSHDQACGAEWQPPAKFWPPRQRANVKVIDGDLFNDAPPGSALGHCVGADFRMGAGIAVEFRERFGHHEYLKSQNSKPGQVVTVPLYKQNNEFDRYIFHIVTKPKSANCLPREEEFIPAIRELAKLCTNLGVRTLSIPQIGAGLDRQPWPWALGVIEQEFAGVDTEVLVFTHPSEYPVNECRRPAYSQVTAGTHRPALHSQHPAPHHQSPAPHFQRPAPHFQRPAPHFQRPAQHSQRQPPHPQRPAPHSQRPTPHFQRAVQHQQRPAPHFRRTAPNQQRTAPHSQRPAPRNQHQAATQQQALPPPLSQPPVVPPPPLPQRHARLAAPVQQSAKISATDRLTADIAKKNGDGDKQLNPEERSILTLDVPGRDGALKAVTATVTAPEGRAVCSKEACEMTGALTSSAFSPTSEPSGEPLSNPPPPVATQNAQGEPDSAPDVNGASRQIEIDQTRVETTPIRTEQKEMYETPAAQEILTPPNQNNLHASLVVPGENIITRTETSTKVSAHIRQQLTYTKKPTSTPVILKEIISKNTTHANAHKVN